MGSMCAGDVRCYAAMVKAGEVVIDAPNGAVKLTVPLEGSTNAMPVMMKDVLVSEHGNWRHLHWGALFSSYGKSPFFDYIAHDLQHIIADGEQKSLLDLNMELHRLIVDFMDLPITTTVVTTEQEVDEALQHGALDLRGKMGLKRGDRLALANVPYYQMWSQRRGSFTPALSILDLLMNEGREGIFTLLKMSEDSSIL